MLTHDGHVAECTGDNIFMAKNNELLTPPCNIGALEGITRDAVIKLARKTGIAVFERMMKMEDVYSAEEVFLTGTAAEIIPVVTIDKRTIGNGKPGRITLRLTDAFRKLTKTDGVRY
jgi:branched-chain amino acid aminotransferase